MLSRFAPKWMERRWRKWFSQDQNRRSNFKKVVKQMSKLAIGQLLPLRNWVQSPDNLYRIIQEFLKLCTTMWFSQRSSLLNYFRHAK